MGMLACMAVSLMLGGIRGTHLIADLCLKVERAHPDTCKAGRAC